MIEQTELVVTRWDYKEPDQFIDNPENKLTSLISLEIMRKRNSQKKGIACRFSTEFNLGQEKILDYVGEDSYVIDFEDVVDEKEILKMIRNSYSKFKEKFDFRKLATVLRDKSLLPLDESQLDLHSVEHMLE